MSRLATRSPLAGVRILPGEEVVTVTREGGLAVWGRGAGGGELQLLRCAELGGVVYALELQGGQLYLATRAGLTRVDLTSLNPHLVLTLALPPVSHLALLPGPRALMHTPSCVLLASEGALLHLPVAGRGASSPGGALLARITADGGAVIYRVEGATFTPFPRPSVPSQVYRPPPSLKRVPRECRENVPANPYAPKSPKPAPRSPRPVPKSPNSVIKSPRPAARPVPYSARAERDYELLLDQVIRKPTGLARGCTSKTVFID